jgi:UDP-N-acetylmuramoylalanine--D-glutamate ligase
MKDFTAFFRGKKITVMGLGLLGRGLGDTKFLVRCGAQVTVTDLKTQKQLETSVEALRGLPIRFKLGGHDAEDFVGADMILRNADVPRSSHYLRIAQENGIPVEMDESLFCKIFGGGVIGITGTRGKTTTTTLVHRILSLGNNKCLIGGNIKGIATLPLLDELEDTDTVVLELSSWQLQGFHDSRISPTASIFTNIYPDHLNRYNGMDDYISDKKAIFLYQGPEDFCVFNGDQEESRQIAVEAPSRSYFFRVSDIPKSWLIKLEGRHNRQNIAAAICLTRALGVDEEIIRNCVESFEGVEHRLQRLGEFRGVEFINDATSTTPVAGIAALESLEGRRIFLIAGGADKNLDLTEFAEAAALKCHRIALLQGDATCALEKGIESAGGSEALVGTFNDLESAVEQLASEAKLGDVILLSPGCASFGLFKNEFDRGETFIRIVREIIGNSSHCA